MKTGAEAIRALATQLPSFRQKLNEGWYQVRITDIRQVETTARYLGTGLYWIAASINIKPGHDYYFYIRSVNTVGKSAFVEAVGRASDDAEGYLDFFKGKIMAGPSVRVNEWFSAYAMAGVAYSRVSTFSGDYLRVIDNKGKTHDVLTGSDDGRHSNTSLAWGAGVQFNPTESVAIDIAYEGSGSGDWRTDGFIVGVGYKF